MDRLKLKKETKLFTYAIIGMFMIVSCNNDDEAIESIITITANDSSCSI